MLLTSPTSWLDFKSSWFESTSKVFWSTSWVFLSCSSVGGNVGVDSLRLKYLWMLSSSLSFLLSKQFRGFLYWYYHFKYKCEIIIQRMEIKLSLNTWVLKTKMSWRNCHWLSFHLQRERLFVRADSDGKGVRYPCAHHGDRSHPACDIKQFIKERFHFIRGSSNCSAPTFQRTTCRCGLVRKSSALETCWCGRGSCCIWLWFGSREEWPETEPVNTIISRSFQNRAGHNRLGVKKNNKKKTLLLRSFWHLLRSRFFSAYADPGLP